MPRPLDGEFLIMAVSGFSCGTYSVRDGGYAKRRFFASPVMIVEVVWGDGSKPIHIIRRLVGLWYFLILTLQSLVPFKET
jgi:hypothetical protein